MDRAILQRLPAVSDLRELNVDKVATRDRNAGGYVPRPMRIYACKLRQAIVHRDHEVHLVFVCVEDGAPDTLRVALHPSEVSYKHARGRTLASHVRKIIDKTIARRLRAVPAPVPLHKAGVLVPSERAEIAAFWFGASEAADEPDVAEPRLAVLEPHPQRNA